ncbi:MAG: PAAR-like domain-containing protein [Polyangiaceae bacterium]
MPYPSIAMSATPGPGYTTKTMIMGTPSWTKKGKTALSNGDQPGVALGVVSSKIMGMCKITSASSDVLLEGGGVVRTGDMADSNN